MIKLSICITTFKRAQYIAQTLQTIIDNWSDQIELVIVDGASPDATAEAVRPFLDLKPGIRYFREQQNSGVDRDYCKAIEYAQGEFCWLMTDDDLLVPHSIERVLGLLEDDVDLVVVNASVLDKNLNEPLKEKILLFDKDKTYLPGQFEEFFAEVGGYLSFIGGVIIRRSVWMSRNKESYYDTLFIHVGVIFQELIKNKICVVADPLIQIRYGNAMWTTKGFEIWNFKWPALVWSFANLSSAAKRKICPQEGWKRLGLLSYFRAIGAYTLKEYKQYLSGQALDAPKILALIIALVPAQIINWLLVIYFVVLNRKGKMGLYDLVRSRPSRLSNLIVSLVGPRFT